MKNKIVVFLLLISSCVFSQVPGYMGKRFSIGYSNSLSFSWLYPSANASDTNQLGINITHCLGAEYSIKQRSNLCVAVEFFKTGMLNRDGYLINYYIGNYSNYGMAYYFSEDKKPIQLRTTNISIGFKFFKPVYISPVGKYIKLEFVLLSSKINYDKDAFYLGYYSVNNKLPPVGNGEYKFRSFSLAFTFGNQRVFYNSLIIDYGFRFGVSPNGVLNFLINVSDSGSNDFEEQLKGNMNYRILASQLFNLHIGIGFLAF